MGPIPASLKAIQPFLNKAEEMKTADPVVAYYCTAPSTSILPSESPFPPPSPYMLRSVSPQILITKGNTWAVQSAISIGLKDTESKIFLASLLDHLEKTKAAMSSVEAITDDIVGKAYMENFAGNIFGKADDEEQTKKATRNTATKFHAASQFMEVLRCFGDLDKEVLTPDSLDPLLNST
jgi:vacuolar protein sorting-associated protein VTA1